MAGTRIRWKIAQAAELRWWQRYLSNRKVEEYLSWKRTYWQQFLEDLNIVIEEGSKVLDAGCGPAGVFSILEGNQVVAIDPLLHQYEEKLEHFTSADYPWVDFQPTRLEEFNHSEAYDWVFCLNAINHVDQLQDAIKKVMDSVRPGGRLVLSTDLHNYPVLKHVFRLLPGDILHPQQHDRVDYQQLLQHPDWIWGEPVTYKKERIFSYTIFVGQKQK